MRRLLFLGVMCVGLAGAGCATDRQSSTDTSAPKGPTPDLTNANKLQGRSRSPGWVDNQTALQSNPMSVQQGQGMPMTGYQAMQQRMNSSFGAP